MEFESVMEEESWDTIYSSKTLKDNKISVSFGNVMKQKKESNGIDTWLNVGILRILDVVAVGASEKVRCTAPIAEILD